MAIISQVADSEGDTIKLGCSGDKGKIQTLFNHTTQCVQQLSRILYKSNFFMQNKANFKSAKMGTNFYGQKDCEEKSDRTFGENKPNQSQLPPAELGAKREQL